MKPGSGKPQSYMSIFYLGPSMEPDSSPLQNAMPFELISCDLCRELPWLITISIADLDEDMGTTLASVEELQREFVLFTSYLCEMQLVYEFS